MEGVRMRKQTIPLFFAALLSSAPLAVCTASRAYACGDESGSSCSTDRDDARYMLDEAVKAVQKDEILALTWFTEMSHGFRTEDLYVYCIGPDHMMSAHPDPKINHTDVTQTLIDIKGYHITYLWPRLETSKPTVKHTMYTKVKDQLCAVGYYD
jgi:hypothetical protein